MAQMVDAYVTISASPRPSPPAFAKRELFLPSQPAFLDAIELIQSHSSAGRQKALIEQMTDRLWDRGIADPTRVAVADCRSVQDHSYRLRRDSPQVAEWYYRLRRDSDERAMRRATERKVAEL